MSFLHTQLYMLPEATYTLMLSSNIQAKLAATVPAKRPVLIVREYGHRNCLLLQRRRAKGGGGGRLLLHILTATADISPRGHFLYTAHHHLLCRGPFTMTRGEYCQVHWMVLEGYVVGEGHLLVLGRAGGNPECM